MPGNSEHPVTLGDLRILSQSCEHGKREGHTFVRDRSGEVISTMELDYCPGGRPATVADLVSALRAEGVLVVERDERFNAGYGHWPKWAVEKLRYDVAALAEEGAVEILDALAEAQPLPPAGG